MSNNKVKVGEKPPNFKLENTRGEKISLSDFEGKQNVYLVFNRGFAWPYCRGHMAQLRQDYEAFKKRNTVVIAVGPDSKRDFQKFWKQKEIPFIGLADPKHKAAKKYEQEVNILKFGRVPAQMLIDKNGVLQYVHYSNSMSDIPDNKEILAKIDELNR